MHTIVIPPASGIRSPLRLEGGGRSVPSPSACASALASPCKAQAVVAVRVLVHGPVVGCARIVCVAIPFPPPPHAVASPAAAVSMPEAELGGSDSAESKRAAADASPNSNPTNSQSSPARRSRPRILPTCPCASRQTLQAVLQEQRGQGGQVGEVGAADVDAAARNMSV
ncbi:hypothetical protein K438DRAFT_2000517 [Mycena galopus ATCC 62051]|nr:hypothetical protein K438DRAFT_2000517 [Mycena galopus ATCC 62051]